MSNAPDLDRRRFCTAAAGAFAASQFGLRAFSQRVQAMTDVLMEVELGIEPAEIRAFHYTASAEDLNDLHRRINTTKWPERETVKWRSTLTWMCS